MLDQCRFNWGWRLHCAVFQQRFGSEALQVESLGIGETVLVPESLFDLKIRLLQILFQMLLFNRVVPGVEFRLVRPLGVQLVVGAGRLVEGRLLFGNL
jgi:hypothetical protein